MPKINSNGKRGPRMRRSVLQYFVRLAPFVVASCCCGAVSGAWSNDESMAAVFKLLGM